MYRLKKFKLILSYSVVVFFCCCVYAEDEIRLKKIKAEFENIYLQINSDKLAYNPNEELILHYQIINNNLNNVSFSYVLQSSEIMIIPLSHEYIEDVPGNEITIFFDPPSKAKHPIYTLKSHGYLKNKVIENAPFGPAGLYEISLAITLISTLDGVKYTNRLKSNKILIINKESPPVESQPIRQSPDATSEATPKIKKETN